MRVNGTGHGPSLLTLINGGGSYERSGESFAVQRGDSLSIPADETLPLTNTGGQDLRAMQVMLTHDTTSQVIAATGVSRPATALFARPATTGAEPPPMSPQWAVMLSWAKPVLVAALAGLAQDGSAAPGFAQDSITARAGLFDMPAMPRPVIRYAAAPRPTGGSVSVSSGDLQIALTQLSIAEGTNDLLRLQLAPGDRRDVILLVSGRITLQELAHKVMDVGNDGMSVQDDAVHLWPPLVVWQDAELALEPGADLQIEAAGGAFLLSFGALDFQRSTARGSLTARADEAAFRPFIRVSGAVFRHRRRLARAVHLGSAGGAGAEPL